MFSRIHKLSAPFRCASRAGDEWGRRGVVMSPVQRPQDHTEDLSWAGRRHAELERSAAPLQRRKMKISTSLYRKYRLVRGRKEQSYGDPEHPPGRTLGMLEKS